MLPASHAAANPAEIAAARRVRSFGHNDAATPIHTTPTSRSPVTASASVPAP